MWFLPTASAHRGTSNGLLGTSWGALWWWGNGGEPGTAMAGGARNAERERESEGDGEVEEGCGELAGARF